MSPGHFLTSRFHPFTAVLLLAAGMIAQVCMAQSPVVTATAEIREMKPHIQVAGTIISRNDTRLAAQVEGQVTWVADVGSAIAQGEAVARLDDVLIQDALDEAQTRVDRELASVKFNQAEVKRLVKLAESNHAAQSRLDQANRDLAFARSELAAARSRVSQATERLERTVISAPFTGVVSEQFIQVGEWADSGTAMVRLVDTSTLEVQAWVPLTTLPFLGKESAIDINVEGVVVSGTIRTLVPVGDDQSRLYELRLSLQDGAWSAGQSVRVSIPTAAAQSRVAVPRDALVVRRDGTRVFRVRDDDTAERVAVTTGTAAGEWISVEGGIRPGDRVVIRGGERLRDGAAVKVSGGKDE